MTHPHSLSRLLPVIFGAALLPGCDQSVNPFTGGVQGASAAGNGAQTAGPRAGFQSFDLGQVGLNAGTMTARDFGANPLPLVETNPFGAPELILTKRSEVALFHIAESGLATAGDTRVLEDELNGAAVIPGTRSPNGFGLRIRGAVVANLDDDAEDEIVVAAAAPGGAVLYRVDRNGAGDYVWSEFHFANTMGFPAADVDLVAGDFDGDKRDEVALIGLRFPKTVHGNDAAIRVIDDPESGGADLLTWQIFSENTFTGLGNFVRYSCAAGDLDGDGIDDLLLGRQGEGPGSVHRNGFRMTVLMGSQGVTQMVPSVNHQSMHADLTSLALSGASIMTVGQFDADPEDEVMLASAMGQEEAAWFFFRQIDLNASQDALVVSHTTQFSGPCHTGPSLPESFAACAVDRFGTGNDEFAFFRKPIGTSSIVRLIRWEPGAQSWTSEAVFDDVLSFEGDAVSLEASDTDADGAEELFASYTFGVTDTKNHWIYAIEDGNNPTNQRIQDYQTVAPGGSRALQIVPGDYDNDGFGIRYTGKREFVVSNPVPIVLMAAVPTKSGVTQNTGLSGTSYRVGMGGGVESLLTTSSTITAKVGMELEDITGLFGGSAKATMERETRTTNATSNWVTEVTEFSSSYDNDVIIFAGNLYLTHEYEVVSAPIQGLVGEYFTLDQPVASQVYKWTVPFYNANVPAAYAIGSNLLPHTVGAPETYRTAAEMNAVSGPVVSWNTSAPMAVGQGGGVSALKIELAEEATTTNQREVDLGAEASFKAYGVSVEGSFSTGKGSAYTVATSESLEFEGVVGDIADPSSYLDWRFDWGMHIYQPWRLSDSNNEPTGVWLPGGYPLTVIDFWTNPVGGGY